jgi:hypothetical protein
MLPTFADPIGGSTMSGYNGRTVSGRITHFRNDMRGVSGIMFALLAVPLLCLGLAGIDYGNAESKRALIQTAADTAAAAGAQMLGAPHDEIDARIRGYLNSNLQQDKKRLDYVLTFAPSDKSLTIEMDTSIRMPMLAIAGYKEMPIHITSTVERPALIAKTNKPGHGIAIELPDGLDGESDHHSGFGRAPTTEERRHIEEQAQQILRQLERAHSAADVEEIVRNLKNM